MRGQQLTEDIKAEALVNHVLAEYHATKADNDHRAEHDGTPGAWLKCVYCGEVDPPARKLDDVAAQLFKIALAYLPRVQARVAALRENNLALRQMLFRAGKYVEDADTKAAIDLTLSRSRIA